MEINGGEIIRNELNENAMGGSEIIATTIANRVNPEYLKEVQIINSRVRGLDESKIRILLCHDLAGDPESEFLANGGHQKFHKIVFVSNWQMQTYINTYNIPWSKCIVMKNAIDPIEDHLKPMDKIRLAYWSTPHRGLNILYPVFEKLCEKHDNIELDVFSSFKIYGWEQRDEQFKQLFDACKNHPKINYHGSQSNEVIREYLKTSHILAYPNTWQETSCLVLMEAMSAGMLCVHPNYGALFETAADYTIMYPFNEDINSHANYFYHVLNRAIETFWNDETQASVKLQKIYADSHYSWDIRVHEWNAFLKDMIDLNPSRQLPQNLFSYSS